MLIKKAQLCLKMPTVYLLLTRLREDAAIFFIGLL